MDAAPAGAIAAAVSAAAPHPARAAAPHTVAESPADQEFCPDWSESTPEPAPSSSDESDVEMGPPSLPQEEDGESDLDDYWDDGRKVNHQDWNTSAVADGNENSDLAQKEKKWDKNTQRLRHRDSHYRENRERRWCKYCLRASHHTYSCRCLAKVWHRFCWSKSWEISWDDFIELPYLWYVEPGLRHESEFENLVACALREKEAQDKMQDDSEPESNVKAWLRRARAKPSRRSPSPAAALRAAKPNQLSTKPAAVAARTSMPADTTAAVVASSSKPVETIDTGADSSERPAATTAAVARRAPKREQPSAAVAASAKVMKVKTEEPEENQRETELQKGAGESKNKNKRKADEDRERMLSKKPRRTSTASSAVAERAPPDPETVPTADLKHRTQVGTNAKGRGATLDRREDPPSLVLSESSSAEPSEASSEEACGVTEEESSEEDAEGEHRIKDEPSEEAEANMRYSGTRRQNQGETEQALAAAVAAEEERQAKYRRTLDVAVSHSDNSAEETATEVDWEQDKDRIEKLHKAIDGKPQKLHHSKPWEALQNAIKKKV